MPESMRRAPIIGDAPASRVRAMGLGSPRNGMPEGRGYVHPGWVGGVPSPADNPKSTAGAQAAIKAGRARRKRKKSRAAQLAEGYCPDCSYPLVSYGHEFACGVT